MRFVKWIGLLAAFALVVACFFPWVTITGRNINISGMNAAGTSLGKPGLLHLIILLFYVPLLLIGKSWSNRLNLLLCAINIGWAFRNYYLITSCQGGECPDKHWPIYVVILTPFLMLAGALFSIPNKRVTPAATPNPHEITGQP